MGIQELIYLLKHKSSQISGIKSTIAKTALIKLAKILQRDKSPEIPPCATSTNNSSPQNPTSDGAKKDFILPNISEIEYNKILNTIHLPASKQNNDSQINKKLQTSLQNCKFNGQSNNVKSRVLRQQLQRQNLHHIFDTNGNRESIDTLLRGINKEVWETALSNELGRLAQGINNIKGNDCIDFIRRADIPKLKKNTYTNIVCDHRPLKSEKYRVRLTVGGDKLEYLNNATSPAASFIETKLLLNSVISDSSKGARFFTLGIKDFFLQTDMKDYEYMKIHVKYFSKDLRAAYNLQTIIDKDHYVYCCIKKGMHGLKQAARLAYDDLVEHLSHYGYHSDPICQNIWSH